MRLTSLSDDISVLFWALIQFEMRNRQSHIEQ